MASFSDDETFEVDSILEQRKRKGVLEYLVRWKNPGEAPGETWEPAKTIAADCAQAVKTFLSSQKKKKRSTSRSRKTSRSRSRSSSRSRKAAAKGGKTKSQSRSRSRGRPPKTEVKVEAAKSEVKAAKSKEEEEESSRSTRSSRSRGSTVTAQSNSGTFIQAAVATTESTQQIKATESKAAQEDTPDGRILRSSTMKTRDQLEVQRVHNDQRPVHKDDNKPRSAIWKVADYAVIALFVLSLVAALILFLEKFLDLAEFKKQVYPDFGVLKTRLYSAQQQLVDLAQSGAHKVSDTWLYLMEQVKGAEEVKVKQTAATGA